MKNMNLLLIIVLMFFCPIVMWACAGSGGDHNSRASGESTPPSETGIKGAAAHWVAAGRLIWDTGADADRLEIRYSKDTDISVNENGVSGGNVIEVGNAVSLSPQLADRFRHISGRPVYEVEVDDKTVRDAVKGQLVAVAYDASGRTVAATRVQFSGIIDAYFFYEGLLGAHYNGEQVTATLWAPTAHNVRLHLYDAEKKRMDTINPQHDNGNPPEDGVWRFEGEKRDWDRLFYRFEVTVYHHINDRINTYEVTDPYSVSLSTDSFFSQFADLDNDDRLKPDGWDNHRKSLPKPTDISLYEAHIRDFSVEDQTVPKAHRGTFLAFTYNGRDGRTASHGMAHLERLSEAGLTHIHLLPINDIATVKEHPDNRVDLHHPYNRICEFIDHPEIAVLCETHGDTPIRQVFNELAANDPATEEIQKPYYVPGRMEGLARYDGFNWGYDPFHFNAPEGSYSTDPDGVTRIMELRKMVQALDEIGLNVVVDVVYNHTFDSGISKFSVLDKVVPGYYHRYNPDTGEIETSTCCHNTAAEHAMMEKLIIDSVLLWAQKYKIDAFRFDLMGHHPRYVMEHLREALAERTLEEHGVDGENIYIYGEGWDFGEVAGNRIFDQATQFNMGGTGIGNFNDRSRDAIRGGNFSDNLRSQGFTSGLHLFPNMDANPNQHETKSVLLEAADRIKVGMAGNLATWPYINRFGDQVEGGHEMIGFAHQPQESVNYIDKHDNETLWDNTQPKLPLYISMDDRVRVHMLSNAFINFGQGVPFYQMGTDILRSKSMDRNSFDSGDWYNTVDFSLSTHNWGIGLPPGWDNSGRWDYMREFLRDPDLHVQREHMELAHQLFLEQLRIRYSSPLFRLATADEIHRRLAFHNTGPDQEPGIIVMSISDGICAGNDLDPELDGILVFFNADHKNRTFRFPDKEFGLDRASLHPVQSDGSDPVVKMAQITDGEIHIPPLTAVVYQIRQQGKQGSFVCNDG